MSVFVVTGGAGFIGSHLVKHLLERGHQVRVLDNLSTGHRDRIPPNVDFYYGDVNDELSVSNAMQGADYCFHLAAVASVQACKEHPVESNDSNLRGALVVFYKSAQLGIPVVYASSAAVYGNSCLASITEDSNLRPLSGYGASKLSCEINAYAASITHGLKSCGLRFFNVFGPGQNPNSPYSGVISIFFDRIKKKQEVQIFGDGSQTRDFIYIRDLVEILYSSIMVADRTAPIFNVCTGVGTNLLQLVAIISKVVKVDANITFKEAKDGDIKTSVGNPEKMHTKLFNKKLTTLEAGINEMFENINKI